jgi:hypothetical protein
MKRECYAGRGGWQICTVCRGRIHNIACSTKRRASIDCCRGRHEQLAAAGFTVGLDDESCEMISAEPYYDWANAPETKERKPIDAMAIAHD